MTPPEQMALILQGDNLDEMIDACGEVIESLKQEGTEPGALEGLEYWESLLCGLALSRS